MSVRTSTTHSTPRSSVPTLGVLAVLALWPCVSSAQVAVAVVEPVLEGDATPEVSREVQDAVLAGIGPSAAQTYVAGDVERARAQLDETAPPAVDPAARLREAVRSLGAQAMLVLRFGQAGQVYEIEAELQLASDGRRLGVVSQTCQVCTWVEALETVARAGEGLRPSLPGIVAITTTPAGATLTVDGAAAPGEGPLALPPGHHTIGASLTGHATQTREVEVVSGARVEVQLALGAAPPPPAAAAAPAWPARARTLAIWGGVAAGLSLAALVPGVIWLAVDGECASGSPVNADGLCELVYDTWPGGLAMTLVGAGLAVAAVVLFVVSRRARRAPPAVAPAVSAAGPDGGVSLTLAGRF